MFENPRRGRQTRNFTANAPKILDLKSSSEQIFFENCRWVPLLIEDLDKAFAKYRGAYHIGSKSKTSEARKRKEQRKKSKNRRLNASNNRRKRTCIIFRSLGGEPVELCYEPHIYGIQ